VLYALGQPVDFVLLVVSFVIAVTVHGWVQARAAHRAGDPTPGQEGRLRPDPRRQVDPFGAIAGAIAGIGWSRQVVPTGRLPRGRLVVVLLAGTAANAILGAAGLVAFRAAGGAASGGSTLVLQRGVADSDLLLVALYLFGLMNVFVAALSLVPLPPLPGGSLLFALAPCSRGWQTARYRLVEQNIGVAVLLALLLIPLGGPQALLPTVLDSLLGPLLTPLLGG
jgi:membrane-associated protease RseP (regulator of RpoE activity)